MKRVIVFLISIAVAFGFSVTAFSGDKNTLSDEVTLEGLIDFAPEWQTLSHISYSCYTFDGAFIFIFTAGSKSDITVKAQLYRDGIFNTKVGDEYVFKTEKKFLQGEILVPIEHNANYFIKVTLISANEFVTKTVKPVNVINGDADGNQKITAADARIILRGAAKLEKMSKHLMLLCDVDADGKITAADARLVLRWAAKMV